MYDSTMSIPKQFTTGILRKCTTLLAASSILIILAPSSIPSSIRRLNLFEPTLMFVTTPVPPIPTWTLPPHSIQYPILASNTASLSSTQTTAMVHRSLKLGITNIDVHLGGAERDGVAEVLRSVPRDALFLVTKMDKPPSDMTDPLAAAELVRTTVETEFPLLGVETVDVLLLKDSASCEVMQAQWAVLEQLLEEGKTRALGTYNYCQFSIDCILQKATTPPALNYIMRHVGMGPDNTDLIRYGEAKGIRTVAYGTLGEPVALSELLDHPTLRDIAENHGRSVEEVALRWNVQAGYAISNRPSADYAPDNTPDNMICPTSSGGDEGDCGTALMGMRTVFGWELTRQDVARLDGIMLETYLQSPTYYSSIGCPESFGVVDYPKESSCRSVEAAWCNDGQTVRTGVLDEAEKDDVESRTTMDDVELRTTVLDEEEKEDEESMTPFFRRKSAKYDERVQSQ